MKTKHTFIYGILFLFALVSVLTILIDSRLIGRFLDYSVPPEPYLIRNVIPHSLSTWTDSVNAGDRNSFGPTLVPVNILLYAPTFLGIFDPWFIGRYQLVSTLFFGLAFFYLLATYLAHHYFASIPKRRQLTLAVFASVLFVFNNYMFTDIIFGSNVMNMTFVFLPLVLYSFFRYHIERDLVSQLLIICSLVITGSTLQHLVISYTFFGILCVVYRHYRLLVYTVILHILLCLYWILPLLTALTQIGGAELAADYSEGLTTSSSEFMSALFNMDYFGNRNMYRLSLGSDTLASLWTVSAFFVTGISLLSLRFVQFYAREIRPLVFTLLAIFLCSVLFIKGGKEPFGDAVLLLYEKLPFINLFRSTQRYMSFLVMTGSLLFFFASLQLAQKTRTTLICIGLLVTLHAMPWWITRDMGISQTSRAKYPGYNLFKLSDGNKAMYALNNDPLEFAILPVPPGQSINYMRNNVNGQISQGSDAGLLFSDKRSYRTEISMGEFQPVMDNLEQQLYTSKDFFNDHADLLKLLNVRYIVLRDDTKPNFSKSRFSFSTKNIKTSLTKAANAEIVSSQDDVTIIKNHSFLPVIYSPNKVHVTDNNDMRLLMNIPSDSAETEAPAIIFTRQNSHILSSDIQMLYNARTQSTSSPALQFRKNSPTRYTISVQNAKADFLLVLSTTYNPKWEVRYHEPMPIPLKEVRFVSDNAFGTVQNNNIPSKPYFQWLTSPKAPQQNHLKANGFANAWIIQPSSICKEIACYTNVDQTYSFDLTIDFAPQQLMNFGLIVSLTTAASIFVYACYTCTRPRHLQQ